MNDPKDWATIWPGPLPLQVMMQTQWDKAFEFLYLHSGKEFAGQEQWLARTRASDDRGVTRAAILDVIETAFANKKVELALAWSFLAADPARPETIQSFIPQVSALLAKAIADDDVYTDSEVEMLQETMNVWMDAAGGHFIDAKVSLFAVAAKLIVSDESFQSLRKKAMQELAAEGDDELVPGLVVMPKSKAAKMPPDQAVFKEIVGKKLPFVLAADVYQVQAQLRREYPHAWNAISLLTKDLREGKPVRIAPVVLLGDPGSGKSRMLRRLSELLGYECGVYRFDASGISDAVAFSGTARGWGNTTPCVPARAIQQSGRANAWVQIEEIDKAGTGQQNGNFYGSITPFLERESSRRYRDISLDAELDLSFVSFVATANDALRIPAHIRDRFRLVKVPLPGLQHLRPLARNIMADMAAEDDVDPRWMAPLDADEEAVIAKAWARAGFSIRKLQKILAATLEARDAVAMKH